MSSRYRHQQTDHSSSRVKQKENLASFIVPIAVILTMAGIFYLIFFSSLFKIINIEVLGNKYVDASIIQNTITQQQNSVRFWILPQSNILAFDELKATSNLIHPRIEQIEIEKSLPNTLRIVVAEKIGTAKYSWQGRWYEIDDSCVVIGEVGGPDTDSLIVSDSGRVAAPGLGSSVCEIESLIFVKSIDANIPQGFDIEIMRYDFGTINNYAIDAYTSDGWYLKFSTELSIQEQVDKLRLFMLAKSSDAKWKNELTYIDLRFGDSRVYYR